VLLEPVLDDLRRQATFALERAPYGSKYTMSVRSTSSEDVMRSMVRMFATGDVASVVEVVADEYHDHQGLRGTEIRGPEGFRLVVETARCSIRGLSVTIEDLIADGDRVAARIRWQGHSLSGDPVDRETIDVVQVRSGRAVEHWGAQL
jgi:predicted ester cyclase